MSTKLRLFLLFIIIISSWFAGLVYFVGTMPAPQETTQLESDIDAIVVLTGGGKRIEKATTLLKDNPKMNLLISGVGKKTDWDTLDKEHNLSSVSYDAEDRVYLGNWATNTKSNAVETHAWMIINEHQKVALVTANYHLPRAIYELNSVNPKAEFVAYTVIPDEIKMESWLFDGTTIRLFVSEYHKYLVSRIRAWITIYD